MARFTYTVSDDRLSSMLANAIEGGSNYWYFIEDYSTNITQFLSDIPEQGGYIEFSAKGDDGEDLEIGGQTRWRLDHGRMEIGLSLMAKNSPTHFADFVAENDDSVTADVFLQYALFGEVIFG